MIAALAVCVTMPAAAQWRGPFRSVDTASLREDLQDLALDAATTAIVLGVVDAYDEQVAHLGRGEARLREWFYSRMVPVEGAAERLNEDFGIEFHGLMQARRRMTTELADQLFGDLRMFLPDHESLVALLERGARRRRVLIASNFEYTPAGLEASFDSLAWVDREVRDAELRAAIRDAAAAHAESADAALAIYERALPDRSMVYIRAVYAFGEEAERKAREAIGENLRTTKRSMRAESGRLAESMNAIGDTVQSMLPADLAERFRLDRIRATREWMEGYRFEADLAYVRSRLTESETVLRDALADLEQRYLLEKDAAARRLREPFSELAEREWFIDSRIEGLDNLETNKLYQSLSEPYREARAFWEKRLEDYHRELRRLAGDRLEADR